MAAKPVAGQEADILIDYHQNALSWQELMDKYDIGRRKLAHILKEGGVPLRTQRAVTNEEAMETVRGLMELNEYLTVRVRTLEQENEGLRKAASARDRADAPRSRRKIG